MTVNPEIIVVSGLPRSGTSLMMQMLKSGGVKVVTDEIRGADTDNPRGYFEYEQVKEIEQDKSWVPELRGKAVKMISMLLFHLPSTERYKILFMDREMEEVLQSQEAMLLRLNRKAAPHAKMIESFRIHLEHLEEWLGSQPNITVLKVRYRELVDHPDLSARRISEFLGLPLKVSEMAQSVDRGLYRNRKSD